MTEKLLCKKDYIDMTASTRDKRMSWWREARFGMFIHYGLYSQWGRHEWTQTLEDIPVTEYEKLADSFNPKPGAPREWAALAKKAGMDEENYKSFKLPGGGVLSLLPAGSLEKFFGEGLPQRFQGKPTTLAEIYIVVDNPEAMFDKALQLGCRKLRDPERMEWGHRAAYCINHDGHILAFAKPL